MQNHKYHYLYKITNNVSGEYYYGVHSTNNLNDYYFGSGSKLKDNIREYGIDKFTKEILEFFPDRKRLMNEEKRIVNEELLKDPKCLNIIIGGGEIKGSLGMKCVINDDGEYLMVEKDNAEYTNFFIGRICINDGVKMKYIKPYELETYISNGWKKGMYNSHDKIWVNKNGSIISIHKSKLNDYLSEGWVKGTGKNTLNNKVCIMKDDTIKYIDKNELNIYLSEGWIKKTWNDIIWINKDSINKRINKKDIQKYIDDGWYIGRYYKTPPRAKKLLLFDLNGNLLKEFERVSDANREGFNNVHKYADKDKIYMNKYILKYSI